MVFAIIRIIFESQKTGSMIVSIQAQSLTIPDYFPYGFRSAAHRFRYMRR